VAVNDARGGGGALEVAIRAEGGVADAFTADVAWEDHFAQLEFFVKSPVLLARAVL